MPSNTIIKGIHTLLDGGGDLNYEALPSYPHIGRVVPQNKGQAEWQTGGAIYCHLHILIMDLIGSKVLSCLLHPKVTPSARHDR